MKKVERSEIVDYRTYADQRGAIRAEAMAAKDKRRIHVGDVLTFLFENHLTVRYQVQEMMLAEQIVREADIEHELSTYNGLLGGPGELGCTLLIEITDPDVRQVKLREWRALPQHLYALLEDGSRVRPSFDVEQMDEERLSSVQFLKFDTGGQLPVGLGSDLPQLTVEGALTAEQRAAIEADLQS